MGIASNLLSIIVGVLPVAANVDFAVVIIFGCHAGWVALCGNRPATMLTEHTEKGQFALDREINASNCRRMATTTQAGSQNGLFSLFGSKNRLSDHSLSIMFTKRPG